MLPTKLIAELRAYLAAAHPSDDEFDRQALALFAHQYQHNLPFQRFCQQRGKTMRTVKSWRDIPAVPISAFKALTLSCVPADQAERTFMTSGTTQAEVMKVRSAWSAGTQLKVSALNALMGTAGMSRQLVTVRTVLPRCWQNRWKGRLCRY